MERERECRNSVRRNSVAGTSASSPGVPYHICELNCWYCTHTLYNYIVYTRTHNVHNAMSELVSRRLDQSVVTNL